MGVILTRGVLVMVKFMAQVNWTVGYPHIKSNIIIYLSMRIFLDEIKILINKVTKAPCPP